MQKQVQSLPADKDNSISCIRLISMIMILLCHFFQYYGNELAWWLNIGVQIFFVVSGFLYGNKEIDDPIKFIKKQFKKILIPYYLFIVPVVLFHVLFVKKGIGLSSVLKLFFCVGTIDGIEHLWFVGYILFCYIITPYLYWFRKKVENRSLSKSIALCIVFLAGIIVLTTLMDFYFVASRFCCYIIGYFVAIFYRGYKYKAIHVLSIIFGLTAIPINLIRICFKYTNILPKIELINKILNFTEPYAHLLLGVFLFLIMYIIFGNLKTGFAVKISDKYSYYVYIVHQVFVLGPFSLMALTNHVVLNYVIIALAICGTAVALYSVSTRILKKI